MSSFLRDPGPIVQFECGVVALVLEFAKHYPENRFFDQVALAFVPTTCSGPPSSGAERAVERVEEGLEDLGFLG